ncbi:DeoR faimly transcriptional regulator [Photobacterium iliopiscarium]|jgi:POT family proton-dependent oligopeptide transporter|uniref:MFS transporter n=1 Tax=Photobacterium iliopiscarium TaxID=56192 RepID=A0ABX5GTB5_9GAMM|nr:peptide MFS transporter [Photobacterium iliopiscarium]KJG25991.1 DeoR faimly transcriptional regulator [Photobacterium iliopiscarium]PSU01241.1 MFS transporter [Photobacterium iliopiscarium]PSV83849.1 MFS transporter [Photobacterium iliopiscarium]PSW98076.1 MFS transporter [Photobacterium iliopiscarium]
MSHNSSGTLLGHPKGLFLLFGTELWERFSYYAMRAILVLYLTDKTINGGLGWTTEEALNLYGIYTGLVYFTPLIGGWIADNILGQRRSIIIGGTLMAIGQFTLALPHSMIDPNAVTVFYVGLTFLIIGNGLFKPNISTMVGDLYSAGDNRRDGAFTIFYMGINIGSLLAGVIAGTASAVYGWKAGFLCAGVGMLMSLLIQLFFAQRYLGDIGKVPAAVRDAANNASGKKEPLTKIERDRLKVILVMSTFVIVFWAGFEQAGGLMNIYSQEYTNRMIGNFEVPAAWFQSLNPFFIILCAPLLAALWVKMGKSEPNSPVKFALAMFSLALGFACMIGAALEQNGDMTVKTSMMWLVGAYFFHTIGELCLSPIGLSMITKLAPLRLASLMMGAWFGANAIANYIAGVVGASIGKAGPLAIFSGIAITAVIAGVLLLLFSNKLISWMHGAEGEADNNDSDVKPQPANA